MSIISTEDPSTLHHGIHGSPFLQTVSQTFSKFCKKKICVMSNTKILHMQQQHCCCCICNICICADYTQHEQITTYSSLIVGFWDKCFCITRLWLPAKCRVSYLISLEPQPHQVTMDTIHSNKDKQLKSPFHLQFSTILQILWKFDLTLSDPNFEDIITTTFAHDLTTVLLWYVQKTGVIQWWGIILVKCICLWILDF